MTAINISVINSLNTPQNNNFIKTHFSSIMKRKKSADTVSKPCEREYSVIEICEENLNDEDNLSKTNHFILINTLYSFHANKVTSLKSNIHFDFLNRELSSRKYLAISVLRI